MRVGEEIVVCWIECATHSSGEVAMEGVRGIVGEDEEHAEVSGKVTFHEGSFG